MADSYRTKLYRPAAMPNRVRPAYRVRQEIAGNAEPVLPAEELAPNEDSPPPDLAPIAATPAEEVAPVKARKPFRVWRWVAGAAVVAALVYGGRVAYSLMRFEQLVYKPIPVSTPRPRPSATVTVRSTAMAIELSPMAVTATPDLLKDLPSGRINILILGTDKRPNDADHYARSDTMILANLDTVTRKVRVMSIPRDLVVKIPGYGVSKINSAYLFGEYYQEPGGGQALAVATVSDYFGVPIDYYVAVNFDGFRKLVDTVGGINVDVPYALDDYNYPSDDEGDLYGTLHVHFDAGLQHMDGKEALRYARTRHADNDFMRNRRQLQVILGVRKSAMSLNLIPTLPSLIDQLAGMVETNISLDKQVALAQFGYQVQASNIITASIDADMISPTTLQDGSEGLLLNVKQARPMLEDFFGPGAATVADGESILAEDTATPTPRARRTATPVATKRRTATPTVPATRRAGRTPTATRTLRETPVAGLVP